MTKSQATNGRACDVIVMGGGLVGTAVAYGLCREGREVLVLDEGDVAFRASRGNFGLVWVQSKGDGNHAYASWTRDSADLWPGFATMLAEDAGISPDYRRVGGLTLCFTEAEMEQGAALIHRMRTAHGERPFGARLLNRAEALALAPGLGPEVLGAVWSPHDGHANPLALLRALHAALAARGGAYLGAAAVTGITADAGGFAVESAAGSFRAGRVVLAAGLDNRRLAPMVGLEAPLSPLKGQILVTERVAPRLALPTMLVRQTEEGSFLIGDSHEKAGFDTTATPPTMAALARNAVRSFSYLAEVSVVRAWAALRVMSNDGYPIYEQSARHPGAFTVNCHSGVTLAAAHALRLAPMIANGVLAPSLSVFSARRFHVRAA